MSKKGNHSMYRRFSYGLFAALALCLSSTVHAQMVYNPANGHYYERVDTKLTFDAAQADAATRTYMGFHGYLVSITSKAENDFLINNLGGDLIRNTWIGAFQPPGSVEPAGGFQWVSGEAWNYTRWYTGEPNNANNNENVLSFVGQPYALGFWNDCPDSDLRGYIVEYSGGYTTSGAVQMQSIVASAPSQNITFTFRPTDGSAFLLLTASVPASGVFTLTNIPPGSYTLHIKGDKYLAANVSVDTTKGDATGVTATLRAGDANNDNVIDIADFGVLVNAYNSDSTKPKSGYDAHADFNGDGVVDIADFGLLVNNYNASGNL